VPNPMQRYYSNEDIHICMCMRHVRMYKRVRRNTSIKEVSMGIYAGVNSRQRARSRFVISPLLSFNGGQ